jgi:Domain of unknown function (DUF4412)
LSAKGEQKMKKLVLLILLFSACFAFADITIVQKVVTAGMMGQPPQNITLTMYIKGSKARIEGVGEKSNTFQIIDLDQKKMWIVDNSKKQVMVVSPEMMDAASQMMQQMGAQAKTDVQKTGKTDTVAGYKCDEYTVNTTGGMMNFNSTQCVTNDVKTDEFEPFRKYAQQYAKMMGNVNGPKGLPVRTDSKISMMGQTFESKGEVTSISRSPIADTMFTVPADYKVVEMPKMPHMPQQQPH